METTSRDSIAHKIKTITSPNELDEGREISERFKTAFLALFESKTKISNEASRMQALKKIYDLCDIYVNDQEPISVCRAGCSWCCTIPVDLLPIEVKYIEYHTDKKSTALHSFEKFNDYNWGYCPLLDKQTGLCSVYEYRPFNCRLFLVYDNPENCKLQSQGKDAACWNSGGARNGYGSNAITALAVNLMSLELNRPIKENDCNEIDCRTRDIRSYF